MEQDPSDTDKMLTKFDLEVTSVLTPAWFAGLGNLAIDGNGQPFNSNIAGIAAEVRERLLTKRQQLVVYGNGVSIMPSKVTANDASFVDAASGPEPKFANLMRLTNGSYLLTFGIITWVVENQSVGAGGNTNNQGSPCVSCRWSESVEMDPCMYSRRTREGVFIIRSDNVAGLQVDDLRNKFGVLGIPKGFLRKRAAYKVDPNGLKMSFSITDEEQHYLPPDPAFEAEGYYNEIASRGEPLRIGEAAVTLKGTKTAHSNTAALLQAAVGIVFAKVGAQVPGNKINVVSLNAKQDLYKNIITVMLRAYLNPGVADNNVDARFSALTGPNQNRFMEPPLGSDPNNAEDVVTQYNADPKIGYGLYGTALMLVRAAAYFDNTIVGIAVDAPSGQLTQGTPVGAAGAQGG